MAVLGTLMFLDDTVVTVGVARGWKVGFGYSDKGTVVCVYVVAANGGQTTNATEVAKLANGKVDVNAVVAYLSGFGVSLTQAVKNVLGA